MSRNIVFIIGALFIAPVQAVPLDTASWTSWTSSTSGSFTQDSNSINVTYTGSTFGVDYGSHFYNVPASFTNSEVTNTPGTNGTLLMTGGTTQINGFHFSHAVVDPIISLFSVGQSGVPVSFNFLNDVTLSILSQGAGNWGAGLLTQTGNSITGGEGNGLLQFHGTYTDIEFTTPNYEFYYGATVGALAASAVAPTSVPEPATYALILMGLGMMGWTRRRS
ncbi:PEP-CTERM sorting domain-containing protein [Nitrosospira sp. Is2]|uniref:PEP-CTERM sorting domain-containing protein n=1 Tax=Nitrosospira sp. Is2 TaxID=3080532 RepID=UPI0029555656|nr:PEP-CTERM sorting domain-containing protein [Nitrosospira sp. Is2]WON72773.1 PEP-CTERM sorting domain-containing protein [Nitrosospira sp. Is2]